MRLMRGWQSVVLLSLIFALVVPVSGQTSVHQAAIPMILNMEDHVQGTGVIIGPRTVMSAQHVVAPQLTIRLADGRTIPGAPVCVEPGDVGLIIAAEYFPTEIPRYPISLRIPQVGDAVTIPGYPYGVWTVKTGRIKYTLGVIMTIDVAVAPGNSGSPIIDATGSVIGVTTRAAKGEAIAVATTAIASCVRFLHLPGR